MLTQIDRLTIYCILCFITFCSLVLRNPADINILPLGGLIAAAFGLWFELHNDTELAEDEEY